MILECDRHRNCVKVQAQLDRGQQATAGTHSKYTATKGAK